MVSDETKLASELGFGGHEPCTVYHKKNQNPVLQKPSWALQNRSQVQWPTHRLHRFWRKSATKVQADAP